MFGTIMRKTILGAALAVLSIGVWSQPLHAQGTPEERRLSEEARRNADAANKDIAQTSNNIIQITEQLSKAERPGGQTGGPPAKQNMLAEEARQRLEWLKNVRDQQQELLKQAQRAQNPAEAWVLSNAARKLGSTATSITQSIVGKPPAVQPQSSTGSATAPSGGDSHIKFNSGGALEQAQTWNRALQNDAQSRDIDGARKRATSDYGQGRAGAGGVALYKTATMTSALDRSKIGSAMVENDRLVLVYGGQKIRFPQFDPQFLALAIRSVYGGEGLVKGTLLANEANAVVLRTGAEQFGDVVWKKEFVPGLPPNLRLGQDLALDLGPGVGVLSMPDPSYNRVTYYGPLKGNVLGQVVQESDMVFSMFWYGVDWKTGRMLDPSKLPGYESAIDIDLKQARPAPPASTPPREPAKNWWEETVWFVWTPGEMSLSLSQQANEFEFTKAEMKVTVWSVRDSNVNERSRAQGQYLTQHFDDFARAFPILTRLREAAKTVAAVRWLKQNNVSLRLDWANNYRLASVDTPDKYRRFSVYVWKDSAGNPQVVTESAR
jgi:hypothetical protein